MNVSEPMKLDATKAWVSQTLSHERQLTRCRFSICGKYVVAGGLEERVLRWDLETETKTVLSGHTSWLGDLAFHPDQQRLFTADYHGTIICWPYTDATPRPQWSIKDAHQGWVRTLAVSHDGNHLVSAGNDKLVRVWSAADGKPVRELAGHENYVFSTGFHPDGKSLVSGDLFGKIHHWEIESGKLLRTLDASPLHTRGDDFLADVGGVRSLAFDATGRLLACGGFTDAKSNAFCPGDPAIIVFDWETGKPQQTLRPKHKSDGPVTSLRFLSDGTLAGHAEHLNGNSSLEFWKPDQPVPIHSIVRASGYDLDLHPDSMRLAVASFEANGRSGNGRHSDRDEYTTHNGAVVVFRLCEKPTS